MHMLSKKNLSQPNLKPFKNPGTPPTTVITANGEVQTREEAQENVHGLELFVTVQILDDTPAGRVIREALRRTRLYPRVGQWSKATSDQEWDKDSVQHGKCLSY